MKFLQIIRGFKSVSYYLTKVEPFTTYIINLPIPNDAKAKIIEKEVQQQLLQKEKELAEKEKELAEMEKQKEIYFLKFNYTQKELNNIKIDRDYLNGKLKARYIIEQFELFFKVKHQNGRFEAWKKFLEEHSEFDFIKKMKLCSGENELSNEQLSNKIKLLYQSLSKEIHAPSFKTEIGEYLIPVPPEMSETDKCILKIMANRGLEWENINFYDIKTN